MSIPHCEIVEAFSEYMRELTAAISQAEPKLGEGLVHARDSGADHLIH